MSDKMGRRTQSRLVPLCPTDEMLMSFLKYFSYFLYFVTVLNHFPQCYLNLKKNLKTGKQRMGPFGTPRYFQYIVYLYNTYYFTIFIFITSCISLYF